MGIPGNFNLSNSISQFDVFKNMSVGLGQNDLALKTVKDGSNTELQCVKHDFANNDKAEPQNAQDVRNSLKDSINAVLDRTEGRFIAEAYDGNESSTAALEEKMTRLKSIVNDKLAISTADSNNKALMASDVEKIVIDVEMLTKGLRGMTAAEFSKLDDEGLAALVDKAGTDTEIRQQVAQDIRAEATKVRDIKAKIDSLTKPLSSEQKAFLKSEAAELKAFQDDLIAKGVRRGTQYFSAAVLDWKFKRAMDTKYQDDVFKLFGDICSPVVYEEIKGFIKDGMHKNPCLKDGFEKITTAVKGGMCTSSNGLAQLAGMRTAALIAADNTKYQGLRFANSQEESLFMDMSPITTAILLKLGYIEPIGPVKKINPPVKDPGLEPVGVMRFQYTKDDFGLSKINNMSGFLLRAFAVSEDGVVKDTFQETTLAMCTSPVFGLNSNSSLDENNFAWIIHNRSGDYQTHFTGNATIDRPLLDNAKEFYNLVHKGEDEFKNLPMMKGGLRLEKQFPGPTNKASAMDDLSMIATYGNYVDPCVDPQGSAEKLLKLIRSGKYEKELKTAIANYKKNLQSQADKWAKMMSASGAEAILHNGIGTTAFRNRMEWIVNAYVKSSVKYLGKKRNCLNLFNPQEPHLHNLFQKAFEMHQKNIVNLLREDGLMDSEIKEQLTANGYSEDEVTARFEYAEAHKGIVDELD